MKLPQSFIDEVLSRIDVVEIIEPRITLKKTGQANYSGLCPFHHEKTPSFSVSQTKQFYYCFGCKANGNAIGFLMAYEKLSFQEAIESLASKANMPLPEQGHFTETEKKPQTDLLEEAILYYRKQLAQNHQAREYLQHRGLTDEIIAKFQIGFAPSGWENLSRALVKTPEIKKQLVDVGMLGLKKDKTPYDRFRDRIMFPIRNRRGQAIAFGGRSLGDQMPKYLNSPESSLFHKSNELYGLHEALQANKQLKQIMVVEGYLDVIALHQFGMTETVATLGTAISTQHIQTLLRFTQSLIFCFDGDEAGSSAAWRALEIALPAMHTGLDLNFLFLPTTEDPDSYLRKVGKEGFLAKIQEAMPLVDFFFKKISSETEINTLAGKTRLVYLVDKYLQKQPKGVFQELMYDRLSKLVGLNLEKIASLLNPEPETPRKTRALLPPTKKLYAPLKLALSIILQRPLLGKNLEIPQNFFTIKLEGMDLLQKVIQIIQQNSPATTGSLLEHLQDEEQKPLVIELASQDILTPDEGWQDELQGAVARIIKNGIEQHIQILLAKGKKEGLTQEEKQLLQKLLLG
ncbi:MAG: DNA primase [Gammaproteobacteria bacterium]|nr:DNA primase [Gammaproteobacteria bacterium]